MAKMNPRNLGLLMLIVGAFFFMFNTGYIPIDLGLTGGLKNFVELASGILGIALLGGGAGVLAMSKGR